MQIISAKKILKSATFNINHQNEWLKQIDIGDVWGIGRRWSKKLKEHGIYTAFQLASLDSGWIKKEFNVVLMRTSLELQGISCGEFGRSEVKQSILSSKSFGSLQSEYTAVAQALSSHCARAVEKLREQQSLVQRMSVFLHTNRFRDDLAQQFQSIEVRCKPTDDLRVITHYAKKGLIQLFKEGYYYKKTGICLEELVPKTSRQFDLFYDENDDELQKTENLMSIFDEINQKFGKGTLHLAAEGSSKPWDSRLQMCSPCYTTRWSELATVRNET